MPNSQKRSKYPRAVSMGANYARRLHRWVRIARDVRGCSPLDGAKLAASVCAGPLDSLRELDRWRDPQLIFGARVSIRDRGVFNVRPWTDDLWHVLPGREPAVERAIRENLRPGDTFVDAGANIGPYTVMGSRLVGDDGTVVSIEMMPRTCGILREHVAINELSNVHIVQRALSDTEGQTIRVPVPTTQHGQASIVNTPPAPGDELEVASTTLENVLSAHEHIALMKMDLEGAEAMAIRGAGATLDRIRAIVFEDKWDASLRRQLESLGFVVRPLDGNNALARRA